jgi:nicotinamide riboside kinase
MRIAISGVQSSGKTVLIKALRLEIPYRNYYVFDSPTRYLNKNYGMSFLNGNTEIQLATIAMQLSHHNKYEDSFFDRGVIDNLAYLEYYRRRGYSDLSICAYNFILDRTYDCNNLIDYNFLLSPEFPIVPDGTRVVNEDQRTEIMEIMIQLYKKFDVHYDLLTGSIEDRVQQVLAIAEANS